MLSVRGCDLRYADSGSGGLPLVFSHGAGADHVMFDDQRDYLQARGYRVVTWDMRGHGLSRSAGVRFTAEQAIADLRALIEHLALDRPVLVGQSLGGNLSQAVVQRHPDLARALIVIGATPNAAPLSWKERLLVKAGRADAVDDAGQGPSAADGQSLRDHPARAGRCPTGLRPVVEAGVRPGVAGNRRVPLP
ncbi:alpha/beta hydrolase [Nonomuraea dietziae]|uniref:alpha/beta fold hydrolase n=1 Tax=Nonomuraea dietziae TaxID=65515 RepID=UPI0031CEC7C5